MRAKKICLAKLVAQLLLTCLWLAACGQKSAESQQHKENKPRPVIAAAVRSSPEQVAIEAVGTSRALRSILIQPAVAGQVVSVSIDTGQKVEQGQVLLELDQRDASLALRNAEVELADAERMLDRYRQTRDSGAVTLSALDEAESQVARSQIAVNRARVDLEYRTVTAPFTGHVGLTTLDPGAWVDSSTVITTLDDRSALLVTFALPELLLGEVSTDDVIDLSTWRHDRVVATGKIVELDSRVDEQARTFLVRARVENPRDALRPGMSFRIRMNLTGNDHILVPEVAVQWGPRGSFVWSIEDGIAQRKLAAIVQRRAGQVLVDTDLEPGALVVMEGIQMMREGLAVRVDSVVNPMSEGGRSE